MHAATLTQPLATPWRRAALAARLHVILDRVATLVVEDDHAPVSVLDARVFEVELVARLVLLGHDGSTLEKRTIVVCAEDPQAFARRVIDTVEWATTQHPGIALLYSHDPSPQWAELGAALYQLAAQIEERIGRGPLPLDLEIDRRRRVA